MCNTGKGPKGRGGAESMLVEFWQGLMGVEGEFAKGLSYPVSSQTLTKQEAKGLIQTCMRMSSSVERLLGCMRNEPKPSRVVHDTMRPMIK